MARQLQPLVASITVGSIPGWSWAVAKTLLVTVCSYVKGQPRACGPARERTVKSPVLEGALLKSRGHPVVFYKNGTLQTRSFLGAWCLICPVCAHCSHSALKADAQGGLLTFTGPFPSMSAEPGAKWDVRSPEGHQAT